MKKLHLMTRQVLDQSLAPFGLSQAQSEIIYILLQRNGQTQAELGRKLNVAAPTISKMVGGLLEKGFVRLQDDETDARRKHVFLTDKGVQFQDAITTAQQHVEAILRQGFSKAELKTLQDSLHHLYENVNRAAKG